MTGTNVTNEERRDGPNGPARVRRTMPLPQKRLVDATHVHFNIIAILDAPSTQYVANRR
jgi:hypothetical protein